MTANQRRSGFRLPWVSEDDDPDAPAAPTESGSPDLADTGTTPAAASAPAEVTNGSAPSAPSQALAGTPAQPIPAAVEAPRPSVRAAETPTEEPAAAAPEPPDEFLRDLIAAMRKVADEARQSGVAKVKADAEEAVRSLEADAERRRHELRERAESDVSGVGEWARVEAERIKAEAEQRVAARHAQLEQQLAAEGTRTEAESKALRSRVEDYERELDAYHAQLNEINDPAAFAAAAKRMPAPPDLTPTTAPAADDAKLVPDATGPAPASSVRAPAVADGSADEVHPAEEEVLAARLAALDQKLEAATAPPAVAAPPAAAAPAGSVAAAPDPAAETTTDIVVKGLGSFGAITGFRQSLSGQPGISGVALSLGQTGEFVFRATHATGFDLAGTITAMEGDNATVESRPEGGLRVVLERSR